MFLGLDTADTQPMESHFHAQQVEKKVEGESRAEETKTTEEFAEPVEPEHIHTATQPQPEKEQTEASNNKAKLQSHSTDGAAPGPSIPTEPEAKMEKALEQLMAEEEQSRKANATPDQNNDPVQNRMENPKTDVMPAHEEPKEPAEESPTTRSLNEALEEAKHRVVHDMVETQSAQHRRNAVDIGMPLG